MKKKAEIILLVVAISSALIIALGVTSLHPVVFQKCQVPGEYIQKVQSQAAGIYSDRLPLLPLYVTVESFSDQRIYYAIHYFPFGTVDMSYTHGDGYNTEKALTRWQ